MDERYDPAFQRGHTAERTRPVAVGNSRRSHLASLEEIAPQLVQPPADGTPVRPPTDDRFDDGPRARVQPYSPGTVDTGTAAVSAQSAPDSDGVVDSFDERDSFAAPRNHWERALWVIGVVLTIGGIVLTWQATNNSFRGWNSSDGPETGYIIMQTVYAIAPGFITVGLATIVALIFRRMLDHDRRSRS